MAHGKKARTGEKKTRRSGGGRGTTVLLVAIFLIGVGLLAYPSFADYWNSFTQSRAIATYAETVATYDQAEYDRLWNEALEYNRALSEEGVVWIPTEEQTEKYYATLNVGRSGSMGFIEIPKINVSLPMYHGTSDRVLQTAIGHLDGTSLPAGSTFSEGFDHDADFGSHCVLSGHRGLPSAKLFSELDKIIVGDRFILTVLDQTLTYEVDQIRIVLPTDVSDLVIEPGKDCCTLVTCTPYGINTHRMLVRGRRVENEKKIDIRITADALQIDPIYVAPLIGVPIVLLLLLWMMFMTRGGRTRDDYDEE